MIILQVFSGIILIAISGYCLLMAFVLSISMIFYLYKRDPEIVTFFILSLIVGPLFLWIGSKLIGAW